MGAFSCTSCGQTADEATASFGETGLVCQNCHLRAAAGDAAQLRQNVDSAAHAFGRAGSAVSGAVHAAHGHVATPDVVHTAGSRTFASAPTAGVFAELAQLGAQVERRGTSSSTQVMGATTSGTEGYEERWTLPRAPGVQAAFAREGLFAQIGKLFSKELQVGDPDFDALVHIKTSSPDATAAWLADPGVRARIAMIVRSGAALTVHGDAVAGAVSWPVSDPSERPQDVVAWLARSLL